MEHKIGTKITLEVVALDKGNCEGCFFYSLYDCQNIKCTQRDRADQKNIIYKEIKEE